jgi:hypothetical protein
VGRGAESLSLRSFSRAPVVVVCCHALIVEGGNFLLAIADLIGFGDISRTKLR